MWQLSKLGSKTLFADPADPAAEGKVKGMRRLETKDKSEMEESSNHNGVDVDGVAVLRMAILVAYVPASRGLLGSTV